MAGKKIYFWKAARQWMSPDSAARRGAKKKGRPRYRSLKSIRRISTRLSLVATILEETYQQVEPVFVQLGDDLQSLWSKTNELTELTRDTAQLIAADCDDSVLAGLQGLTRQALVELESCQADISGKLATGERVWQALSALTRICGDINQISQSLRMLGFNMAVESSCSQESDDMFASFVKEIKALGEKIVDISENIQDDAKRAGSSQRYTQDEISRGLDKIKKLTCEARRTVDTASEQIEHLIKLSLEALQGATVQTQAISRQVGEIVSAIQFHDITRQQVEHVITAVNNIEALNPKGGKFKFFRLVSSGKMTAAHSLLRIQKAQLKEVISEINSAHRTITRAFDEIGQSINKLVAGNSQLGVGTTAVGEDQDPFTVLKKGLERLNILVEENSGLVDRMQQTMHQASSSAAALLGHAEAVRGVNTTLHFNALNACVKTALLGEQGRTLSVLAEEVTRLSKESARFVTNFIQHVETITIAADPLENKMKSEGEGSEQADTAAPSNSLSQGIEQLSLAYDRFRSNSAETLNRAEVLQLAVTQTAASLHFLPDLAEQLEKQWLELEQITHLLHPWTDKEGSRENSGEVETLSGQYTMASERAIHKQLTEGLDEAADGVRTQDIGENGSPEFELFEAEASSLPSEDGGAVESEELDDDNIELF